MTMLVIMLLMSSLTFMMMNFPLYLIMIGTFNSVLLSVKLSMEMNIKWISYIIIIMYVSGLMVIYMFIISMNPNNKSPQTNFRNMVIPILLLSSFFSFKNQTTMKFQTFMFFSWSWNTILMMTIVIMVSLTFMTKLIFTTSKTSKSMK